MQLSYFILSHAKFLGPRWEVRDIGNVIIAQHPAGTYKALIDDREFSFIPNIKYFLKAVHITQSWLQVTFDFEPVNKA